MCTVLDIEPTKDDLTDAFVSADPELIATYLHQKIHWELHHVENASTSTYLDIKCILVRLIPFLFEISNNPHTLAMVQAVIAQQPCTKENHIHFLCYIIYQYICFDADINTVCHFLSLSHVDFDHILSALVSLSFPFKHDCQQKFHQIASYVLKHHHSLNFDINILFECCYYHLPDILIQMLDMGADVNWRDNWPIKMAVEHYKYRADKQTNIIEILLQYGAKVSDELWIVNCHLDELLNLFVSYRPLPDLAKIKLNSNQLKLYQLLIQLEEDGIDFKKLFILSHFSY